MARSCIGLTLLSLVYLFICVSCVQFGYKDLYTCHCAIGSECDPTTGICSSRSCQDSWYGPSCQKQNVALNKQTNQSIGADNRDPNRAVDGDVSTTKFCADTGYNAKPSWLVNLQQTYPIRDVKIYYKADRLSYFEGFSMIVIGEDGTETLCYKDTPAVDITAMTDVRCNVSGQHIKFINPRPGEDKHFMTLCEVQVFVCSVGTYGSNCVSFCYCANSVRCNQDNGTCPNKKCQDGWMGGSCNEECDKSYGQDCSHSCNSRHCKGSSACHHVTGTCVDGCLPGYRGDDCTHECEANRYGQGCSFSCTARHCKDSLACDHVTGTCVDGCLPGYQGGTCTRGCDANSYGQGCSLSCTARQCKDSTYCDHVTGTCDGGCLPGYQRADCALKCDANRYGQDCSLSCTARQCKDSSACDHVTGTCVGGCLPGYQRKDCFLECSGGFYGTNCSSSCKSRYCNGSQECDHVTGKCLDGCQVGYEGTDCLTECTDSYGVNCSSQCSSRQCAGDQDCNHINGSCTDGCQPGYQNDECTQGCTEGWYGEGCFMNCSSRHCGDPMFPCDHVTGSCGVSGCFAGYSGSDCQQECADEFYGINCTAKCSDRFCEMSSPCHHVSGDCEGKCQQNYNGTDCTQKLFSPDDKDDEGGTNNTLIIAVSVSVAVILVAGIAFFIWRRRRSPKHKEDKEDKEIAMVINRNNKPKMAVVKPQRPHSAEDTAPIYENREFIELSLEASSSALTEVSGESENTGIELKNNRHSTTKSEFNYTELKDFIAKTKAENGFDALFESLPTEFTSPYDASQLSENKKKNRFKGYYPYDNTRVKLSIQDGNPHTDFINANYLHGWNQPNAYIAAQGATDITTNDFIRMIWEQNCDKVVMVTREYEIAKIKCKRYWPENGTETFGDFKLTLIQEKTRADFTVRVVSIQKDNIKHQFRQFHYTSWPDHGVPDVHDLLDFLFTVNKVKPKSTKPQLVHCSAGVGRTGTFIAIDFCLKQWKETGQVEVMPCIKKMRDNRKGMIQTESQLKFVFEALLEGMTKGDTSLNKDVFEADYDEHGYNLKMGQLSSPEHFQLLKSIQNDTANINKVYSEDKPLFSFSSYTNSKGYFFESLIGLDVDTMWKMIHDRQSTIAVFIRDNMNQTGLYPGSGSKEVYNDITVENISQENLSDKITRISVSVTQKELQTDLVVFMLNINKSQVKNFRYLTQNILELLQHITVDQRIDDSITIFTSNLQYVRVFCILRNIIQRILLDNEVEIVQNVRKMHQRIEKTIFTEEEFKVLYQVISEYIKSTGTYANM